MPRMLGYASKQPFRVGKPKVQDLVAGPGTIPDAYAYYGINPQEAATKDLVEMIACQAGDPNCGAKVLQMLRNVDYNNLSAVQTMMGRNPLMQKRIRKGAAPLANAYYQMQNIGLPKDQMLTGRDRLRAVSQLLNNPGIETALRGVPLAGTAAAGLGTLAAIDAVTESPEERQLREALAAIQYMGG